MAPELTNTVEHERRESDRQLAPARVLDALVALGFLEHDGDGRSGRYRNTEENARALIGAARGTYQSASPSVGASSAALKWRRPHAATEPQLPAGPEWRQPRSGAA